ncbi:hypothetical protein [Bacteroidetes bacterium endosymbiont of Geopemphigus sp.]|uniref:hypothetical protein n=1 Tax=Bacteroidetes bacterium endosymbiont of Geopemphigus sp. TaxID=2047937 RepID=UPI0018A83E91|nr:hypothetical protein [Bacteroidetes bacterium endosymbiont of Geopemphigus sp.]
MIQASKRIKSETHLSTGVSSVAYIVVHYILKEIPEVSRKNIFLYDLGKIGHNVCENLLKYTDHKHITLINRTHQTARSWTSGRLLIKPYEQLQVVFCEIDIREIDILIVATSAPSAVILSDMFSNRRRSLLILDLSIPENVDPLVSEIPGIHLLNVDALSQHSDEIMDQRKKEIPNVEIILDEVKKEFFQ